MKSFSYTKTPQLISRLEAIDQLRTQVLISPLTPKAEMILRFKTLEESIGYLRSLDQDGKSNNYNYRQILDYIYLQWTGVRNPLDAGHLEHIFSMLDTNSTPSQSQSVSINQSLKYLQANTDHPILQAALAYIMLYAEQSFPLKNAHMAYITFLVFLNKSGYGMRGMFSLGQKLTLEKTYFQELVNQAQSDNNVSPWLNFIIDITTDTLTNLSTIIHNNHIAEPNSQSFQVNSRQEQVLSRLLDPGSKISNKQVQNLFHVSPITASRDLAQLVNMGLLLPLGKGRSTYYTRV